MSFKDEMSKIPKKPKIPEKSKKAKRRPEEPKGGPKGLKLEVGARRAPKLLVKNNARLKGGRCSFVCRPVMQIPEYTITRIHGLEQEPCCTD